MLLEDTKKKLQPHLDKGMKLDVQVDEDGTYSWTGTIKKI